MDKMIKNDKDVLQSVFGDTCVIIEEARKKAFRAVNTALTVRNWQLGERIAREHLGEDGRAEYGKHIMESLANMLTDKYGKGVDKSSLYKYVKFYSMFPEIVDAVRPQSQDLDNTNKPLLPWSLYRELIRVENDDARKWYATEAAREIWSSRTLHRNIASQYYFRMLQTQVKDKVRNEMHQLTAPFQQDNLEFIKNPVVAEFLGFEQNTDFTESDLESSIP